MVAEVPEAAVAAMVAPGVVAQAAKALLALLELGVAEMAAAAAADPKLETQTAKGLAATVTYGLTASFTQAAALVAAAMVLRPTL